MMMRITMLFAFLFLLFVGFIALADEYDGYYRAYPSPAVGEITRDWLDMQREGRQASSIDHSLPPRVQDRIYQRYLDSYEHPIPENYFSLDRFRDTR
jgi:hypothetical protein